MKISMAWLNEWVDHGLDAETLGHKLTMAGLELDAIEPVAGGFSGIVVAEVVSVQAHPNADKLRICVVNDGTAEPKAVVCGAPNVHEGMRAPFAPVGSVLPNDFKIKPIKLRGAPSNGMLCSARELGLSEDHVGLMALPADAPVGQGLRDYLSLDDQVLEIDLTPNRADCLSMAGIAREVATLTGKDLRPVPYEPVAAASDATFPVSLEAGSACPLYAGRVIQGVNGQAATPLWMQERLRRAGIRSLGPLVDVTNYVMLELGQPMHAFDLGRLSGQIHLRQAKVGEKLTLLDESEAELSSEDLVIADDQQVLALAGVMGGQISGVDTQTQDIFLESAHFAPMAIAGRARAHGLHTESSHRFERGVDPELPLRALERATALLLEIAGGEPGPAQLHQLDDAPRAAITIDFRPAQVERLLGINLTPERMQDILQRLGCQIQMGSDPNLGSDPIWQVAVPSYRFDLAIEVDLIEELGRVEGYEQLPSVMPQQSVQMPRPEEQRLSLSRLRHALADLGYLEAICFSFVDAELQNKLEPGANALALANPISADLGVMRLSLWPGLINAAKHNLNRQQDRIRLFETGLRFVPKENELKQEMRIAGLVYGPLYPLHWDRASHAADFFDIKGDVETLLALSGLDGQVEWCASEHPALHPAQSAAIFLNGARIGHCGSLNPLLERDLDLPSGLLLFELDLEAIRVGSLPAYSALSRFPAIRRDIALLVDTEVPAARILECIHKNRYPTLKQVHIFDLYTGKGVPDGRKSVALGLILQDLSSTLTDEEVDTMIHTIVSNLQQDLGATLRV